MPVARRSPRMAAIAALVAIISATLVVSSAHPAPRAEAVTPPNIVLILTDDQRWDTLWAMPTVQSELVQRGVTFSNAFVTNSLCCPSRATILTGGYSHTHGVYTRIGPGGEVFDDSSTAATWLRDGGYRTGLIGKYLNGYSDASYVPPGWDRWFAFASGGGNGNYYGYDVSVDGSLVSYGSDPTDYSTDVFAGQADSFIRSTDPAQALFLYFSPNAPHGPTTPADRHMNEFADLEPWRPPNHDEADVSDKPAWVQAMPQLSEAREASIDEMRKDQYRTLLAVDEAVATILAALSDTGRLSNTLIVFSSDNGYLWGEHRIVGKVAGYEESIRVPLVVRYDPVGQSASTNQQLVANIDLAPTFAEVAGVASHAVDGTSWLPLLGDPQFPWRKNFLVEHQSGVSWGVFIPTYCEVRAGTASYTWLKTGEEELYDLVADPGQLDNVSADPEYDALLRFMRRRGRQLCNPPPPGVGGR